MKKALKVLGVLVLVAALAAGGFFLWATQAARSRLAKTYQIHKTTFPVPYPLDASEVAALWRARQAKRPASSRPAIASSRPAIASSRPAAVGSRPAVASDQPASKPATDPLAGVNLAALAHKRAVARGEHLVRARYACVECHGQDFGGGTMMDAMPVARLFGPNLTQGKGSVVRNYTLADWDRLVRHGVRPDGRPTVMPAEDFFAMSDRELSDIIVYIRAQPPVDRATRPREFGPVGKILLALGKLLLSAERHPDHAKAHRAKPPLPSDTLAFGKHLANLCTGCHRADFAGGPIPGGDPKWAPAANITPHKEGLVDWSYADFLRAMREAKSKDGRALRAPMIQMAPYAQRMTDRELRAIWAYLKSRPALPSRS